MELTHTKSNIKVIKAVAPEKVEDLLKEAEKGILSQSDNLRDLSDSSRHHRSGRYNRLAKPLTGLCACS
jgi:hypothetical protein